LIRLIFAFGLSEVCANPVRSSKKQFSQTRLPLKENVFMRMFTKIMLFAAISSKLFGQNTGNNFDQWDVFTDRALTGNQVAVFINPKGLDADTMMGIAREFGHSETTFVYPSRIREAAFRVRIFQPGINQELPIAGHPIIGTVFALANAGKIKPGTTKMLLDLNIGPTPVEMDWSKNHLQFAWLDFALPNFQGQLTDRAAVASALGLDERDIRPSLPIQQVDCGGPFIMVPLTNPKAVDRATFEIPSMGRLVDAAKLTRRGVMVFARSNDISSSLYTRMFSFDGKEDAGTGTASASLGSYLVKYKLVTPEQAAHLINRQGIKMRRPSEVHISIHGTGDKITRVQIGGSAALASTGQIAPSVTASEAKD
jgi:trans-2,3-dihydro-3-hydroxyanthranilate isomerase